LEGCRAAEWAFILVFAAMFVGGANCQLHTPAYWAICASMTSKENAKCCQLKAFSMAVLTMRLRCSTIFSSEQ
jgi:hypothetical protein